MALHSRMKRINEMVRQILAELLLRDTKDERLILANVTSVTVSTDLTTANVRISCLDNSPEAQKEMMDGLESAKGWLRHEVGQRISLRKTPDLRFFLDESSAHAMEISKLLDEVRPEGGYQEDEPETPES